MLTRRALLASGFALIHSPLWSADQPPTGSRATETQKGDPDLVYETITYDPEAIRDLSIRSGKAVFEPWDPQLPAGLIAAARGFIGDSRMKTPGRISPLLELFYLKLTDAQGTNVPFCAAGVSFCALSAYADTVRRGYASVNRMQVFRQLAADLEHYYFYPTVSCNDMALIAKAKRRWRGPDVVPKPGWVVLFDWGNRGHPDHCGIVQTATAKTMFTVEFNTAIGRGDQRNSGVVAEKNRSNDRRFVAGYIATDVAPVPI